MRSLISSFRRTFDSFLQAVGTRMDLFAVELQEEKIRVVHIVLWTCGAVFLTAITLVMLTMTIVLAVGDEHKILALAICTGLYTAGAVICSYKLYQLMYQTEKPFAETVAQLKLDRERLKD